LTAPPKEPAIAFRRRVWISVLVLALLLAAVGAAIALTRHPPMAPAEPPTRASFSATTIARGAQLAAIGNCASCHTTPGGQPFAGGVAVPTPFGVVYGSNVTPDPEHGIGRWSQAAFVRALRQGIARNGEQLYPAFPYDHYTHLGDADIAALYAYLMTRPPVDTVPPANEMRFPFGWRPLVAGWNLLFLDRTPYRVDPKQGAEWNRGAYLVQSLAHCGSCHTPRNALGAEIGARSLAGGTVAGWHAPALNAASPSPLPWTVPQLVTYLRGGVAYQHGIAAGPMQQVTGNLAQADPADVQAIAVYIASFIGGPTPEREALMAANRRRAELGTLALTKPADGSAAESRELQLGASIYAAACARCHDAGRRIGSDSALQLPLALAVHNPDPGNLIRIIRGGISPLDNERGRWMPAFGAALTDEQMTALVSFLRRYAAAAPPWSDVAAAVAKVAPSP
jgi:mono/diheme cytochrome c family protein